MAAERWGGLGAVARYTFKIHMRQRTYLAAVLFGAVLILAALVLSRIAHDERVRMILDLGVAANELIALVSVVFILVRLLADEIDSRGAHLFLAHPLRRSHYVLGRFAGTFAAVLAGMAVMAAVHLAILGTLGWRPTPAYAVAFLGSAGEIALMGGLSLLLSLSMSSAATAMAFSAALWTLGHFCDELRFLGEKSGSAAVEGLTTAIALITPNFGYLRWPDLWLAPPRLPPVSWYAWLLVYEACYLALTLFLACSLFAQRDL